MSSSSASRSPSPHTPSPGPVDQVAVHTDFDRPSWYHNSPEEPSWTSNLKSEDTNMLQLDDLIEQHAYEDVDIIPQSPKPVAASLIVASFRNSMPSGIKPIPPPALPPRKPENPSRDHKVVHPPKESCYNLPIMFPSIPESGTKSRVETQVRVTVDLADPSSSTDPHLYDRVGSWKWLKLPSGTATKRRTRKQGKIDPEPQDMLYLTVNVSCASPPHNRVLSCSSCQIREAKRVAKKIAARVRPARNSDADEEYPDDPNSSGCAKKSSGLVEDTSSIIQFNCAEVVDFSTGSAVLPIRITCYCRHHREKTGFNVNLAMMDFTGRTVGVGSSSPIMITDDHKTTAVPKHADLQPHDWCKPGSSNPTSEASSPAGAAKKAPSKRKTDVGGKKRVKPYDSSAKPNRGSRETSVVSNAPSPTASEPVSGTTAPSPPPYLPSTSADPPSAPEVPPLQFSTQESESSPDVLTTPLDIDIPMLPEDISNFEDLFALGSQSGVAPNATLIPPSGVPASLPFLFAPPQTTLSMPTIHRLIPNCGPTHGGIEVTVLGANFHPTLQFNCIFGDMPASSTQRWSDNTLVCILPPRLTAGMVSVWFEGFPKVEEQPPSFFTYSDESDRALMELALQVVGLKMTGKIEDAKNVAMRIVGAGEGTDSQNSNNQSANMQLSISLSATRDLRSLMLVRAGDSEDFESLITNFLKLIDTPVDHPSAQVVSASRALSHTTKSGQSLLHLAAFLGYGAIVEFLLKHGIDMELRDRNGYTALHFASMAGSRDCIAKLLKAGADREIVNALGKTAEEIATKGKGKKVSFEEILEEIFDAQDIVSDDEEAEWGDAEEDAEEKPAVTSRRRAKMDRRARRSRAASRKASREELRGHHTSKAPNMSPLTTHLPTDEKKENDVAAAPDEKQALSFIDMLQRTMAQLPGAPQLPFPHFPHAMPWEALHQLNPIPFPMVFPVAVPLLPGWLSGEHRQDQDDADTDAVADNVGKLVGPFKAAQEWRVLWEKWLAHVPWQATEMPPPPQYTPRATPAEEELSPPTTSTASELVRRVSSGVSESESLAVPLPVASGSRPSQDVRRRYDYNAVSVTDQEVNAYAYQPKPQQKKHDRMLLLFWLPILMISLLWACHTGLQFVIRAFRTPMAFKKVLGF
ncbi:hypothetical protein J3R30DRAFT_1674956 [Lentinula aciculospora]|uniref:IPT/TIG domain-containing protein n=1 Tax=Lentinula aciculospora TaxID=153920 RepID=A0A9W8ZVJ7_9AGAR|nr:hypothetical protein J3R30DRAFT_1674956 [Lentinula aciculospora]